MHGQADNFLANFGLLGGQAFSLAAQQPERRPVIKLDLSIVTAAMRGSSVYMVAVNFLPAGKILERGRDERMPEERPHAGPYSAGVVGIDAVLKQQKTAGTCRVDRSQDRTHIPRVLRGDGRHAPGAINRV